MTMVIPLLSIPQSKSLRTSGHACLEVYRLHKGIVNDCSRSTI